MEVIQNGRYNTETSRVNKIQKESKIDLQANESKES
jgi:hypothetical protein